MTAIDGHSLGTVEQARAAAIALRASRPQVIRVDLLRRGEPRHFYLVRTADDRANARRGESGA